METKQRDISVDILKGVAIFLVILGHAVNNCIDGGDESRLSGIIYFMHMPIFLVLSGYLCNDKHINRIFFIKIGKRFLIPYIVWTLIQATVVMGFHTFKECTMDEILYLYVHYLFCGPWFVRVYVVIYLLWQLLQFVGVWYRLLIGSLLLVALNFISLDSTYFSELMSLSLYSYTMFGLGVCLRNQIRQPNCFTLYLSLLIVLTILPFALPENNYFICSSSHMFCSGDWYIFIIRLLFGLCFVVLLENSMCDICRNAEKKFFLLQYIGKNSLQIYLLQGLVVEIGLPIIFHLHLPNSNISYCLIVILSIVTTIACSMLVTYTSKIKNLESIVWGKS